MILFKIAINDPFIPMTNKVNVIRTPKFALKNTY